MNRTRSSGAPTRLFAVAVTLLALTSGALVGAATPAGAAAPFCGITWGSLDKSEPTMSGAPITNARTGQHDCYDRLVVDLGSTPAPGYNVRYVNQVIGDGSGEPVPLRGGAFLQITVRAPAHDLAGHDTYSPANPSEAANVTGFRTFRQLAFVSDFEGISTFGLGVRARLPFRVSTLAGPGGGTRLVIDVAHRWS